MEKFFYTTSVLFLMLLAACNRFEYDPNQSVSRDSYRELNYKNIGQLSAKATEDSVIKIAFISDTHINYQALDNAIERINQQPDIDMVIHGGDLTNYGILQQFNWTAEQLSKLNKPFITVIGNHDIVGNGEATYKYMFGHLNFSFIYGRVKFVFFNSNSREYNNDGNVPDLDWVQKEIETGNNFDRVVLVSHVPYFDEDFDFSKRLEYLEMLSKDYGNKKILISLGGHQHNGFDTTPSGTNIPHFAQGSIDKGFALITISGKNISYEKGF